MRSHKTANPRFEKLIWIELIGFDNRKPDFGVGELLSRMECKPSKVALLLCDTELIHAHDNLDRDFRIGAQHCSYVARPYNSERRRQDDWTAFQLRDLNRTLRSRGVEVYAAFFDYVMFEDSARKNGIPDFDAWNSRHKELLFTIADGSTFRSICHFKHLADGTLYEDFFAEKLSAFLTDYEFDGWLACDGFAHPRLPIYKGDFSDDVTVQFEQFLGKPLPVGTIAERSVHILANLRLEWMHFCVKRQSEFIRKTVAAAKASGKSVIAFNAWTRDPFEAIWRYGTDYRDIRDAGVDAMVVECSTGVVTIEGWNCGEDTEMLDRNRAMLMRISAYVPELPLYQLYAVKDDCEEYCVLRHAPPLAATEILSNGALFSAISGKQCLSGAMICLGDAIEKHEWNFLDDCLKSIFAIDLRTPISPLLVMSKNAMENELEAYSARPVCNSFRLCSELIANGAPISLVGGEAEPFRIPETPVLIIHPFHHPKRLIADITSKCRTVILIGLLDKSTFGLQLFNGGRCTKEFHAALKAKAQGDEPIFFWHSQPEMLPPKAFWKRSASLIRRLCSPFSPGKSFSSPMYRFNADALRLTAFGNGILIATNTSKDYMPAVIISKHDVTSAESLTFYPAIPVSITPKNNGAINSSAILKFKIPPYGTSIIKVCFQQNEKNKKKMLLRD